MDCYPKLTCYNAPVLQPFAAQMFLFMGLKQPWRPPNMMNALRNKKFMHFILWIIVFVFVVGIFFVFGMKSKGFDDRDPNLVARIGENTITYTDFNKTYQPALDKLYRAKEDTPTASEIKKLKDQVLEHLIDEAILQQTGQKLGITVPDEELVGWLQRQNYFLDDNGKFSKTKYYQMLQANQLTPEQFENSQRNQMLTQKIQSILFDGVLLNNNELTEYAQFLNRDLKAAYVSLDLETYEKRVSATEENLKDFYQSNKSQYDHPERAKVRHILISLQGNESIQDQDKAKVSLEDYRKQILSKKATFE
ncbi:MAG: SurA N-terminal domain-containing protein, partial [Candidatus Paceibacterales bacterium]